MNSLCLEFLISTFTKGRPSVRHCFVLFYQVHFVKFYNMREYGKLFALQKEVLNYSRDLFLCDTHSTSSWSVHNYVKFHVG
jgi:hypothetical protein